MRRFVHFSACVCLILTVCLNDWAQKPELVVRTGHSGGVTSVAISPDGTTLASGSTDKTIKLWDVASGTELRTLKAHSDYVFSEVSSVAFSPDGTTLASSNTDKTIKLWDVATGRELRSLKGDWSGAVAFSPDGKILASDENLPIWTSGSTYHIKLWDISTGAVLRTLKGHDFGVTSIGFSPDGKTLASGSRGNIIKLWDVATGRELRTLKGHSNSDNSVGFTVESVAFSPDGKILASGGTDKTVKLWDVSTGRELRTLKGHSGSVTAVAFSPDGKILASGGSFWGSADYTVKLWEVSTGRELRTLEGHSFDVNSVAFSPDGETLASGSGDRTIKLWDVASGRELRTLEGHSNSVKSIALMRILKGDSNGLNPVGYSPDGKTFASTGREEVVLWDVVTGQELRSLKGHSAVVTAVAFSLDGKTLASGSADYDVRLWDVATGTLLHTLEGHLFPVNSVVFSFDGKTLASCSGPNTVKLWDVSTGAELHSLETHLYPVNSVAFSPDGEILASGSLDATIKLWDVSTGRELHTLKGHSGSVNSVAFSSDGKILASGSADETIKLWAVLTGAELRTLEGHSNSVNSVTFSLNDKYLVSESDDASIKVWEISSGKAVASLITFDVDDWVVVTPDGLFDGSPGAWKQILWRFNNNTFDHAPVEAFFNEFYYPGLLSDVFAGKRPKAPSDISQKDRRQPQLKLTMADAQTNAAITARNVTVKIDVSQALAGTQDVRLFRNGSLVKVWHGDVLKGQTRATLEARIPIVAGENRLTAYAFNHDNIKSSDATLKVNGVDSLKRQGTAYVLAVGVNSYSNPDYNLKYAVADAEDFAAEFKRQQEALKNYGRIEVIPLYDKQATKANILQVLERLAKDAQPEDAVVVYFAGHGTAKDQRFYLIPHDLGYEGGRTDLSAVSLKTILEHSISDRELEDAFEKIDAGRFLTVIDACNSGQAIDSEEKRRGPMNSKGLAQLAYEKGMYILTASQSFQAALEVSELGHGLLTYALVEEGLKGAKAERNERGEITERRWLDYAGERVPQMQMDKMLGSRSVIVFLAGDEKIADPKMRNVQRPRLFYRRELEDQPLIVARPQTVQSKN